MDSQFMVTRSLPPLVEGKIHGYLKCIIDEIIWIKRNPGNVSVIATWWGEFDNATFRIGNENSGIIQNNENNTEIYAVKTNVELFKEYLKNSETLELTIVAEKSRQVIGTAHVSNLLEIFTGKSYFQYFPIYNVYGCKIGNVHVTLKFTFIQNNMESSSKFEILTGKQIKSNRLLKGLPVTHTSNREFNMKNPSMYELREEISEQNEKVYQSILRDKRSNFYNVPSKINTGVADKLVAQIVARAQKLRGEMVNDAEDIDPQLINEDLELNSLHSNRMIKNEANLYEYFMGKEMSHQHENKALETLKSLSPTSSLIDFATKTIQNCSENTAVSHINHVYSKTTRSEELSKDIEACPNDISIKRKQTCPINYVDSLRILVDSLTLNSAGYRRVKSSCSIRDDGFPISVTYFVQYNPIFGNSRKLNRKTINGSKPVRMCSKKQDGQVIYFNHNAVYDLSKAYLNMNIPIKFKIFYRHLNQRTPTELGIGSTYISDTATTPYLTSIQRLAIIKKDIKIGELRVTIELGCDKIHFGRQFVEAIASTKENIPILELSLNSINLSNRHRSATSGDESKGKSKSTSALEKRDNSFNTKNSGTTDEKINEQKQEKPHEDGRVIKIDNPRCYQGKMLLHALIYINEGKNLPIANTYLISRAFWREDRAFSQICTGTSNPFYDFHQLIPLIHDQELLNRTKDNCIITEVYTTNPTGNDNLLGIAKLSVHQLYVAYRDPQVLHHLLKSKYPVTSVDGWVSITDPVTGAICGELSALVALGTADQIALLEMTRGLRNSSAVSQTPRINASHSNASHQHLLSDCMGLMNEKNLFNDTTEQRFNTHSNEYNSCNVELSNMKSQECQTEISTMRDLKSHQLDEGYFQRNENTVLHAIVDRLAETLYAPRINNDQGVQTECEFPTRDSQVEINKACNIEPLCLDASKSNTYFGDSLNNSPREDINMSREIFRSVGVGAEFDETVIQTPNINYAIQSNSSNNPNIFYNTEVNNSMKNIEDRDKCDLAELNLMDQQQSIEMDINPCEVATFQAIVQIECALHLPKIQMADGFIEPSTYITFEKVHNNTMDRTDAYMVTNICPYTCNPKYDWRCDTKLSIDLLVEGKKKLIMKVWRIIEPNIRMEINLDRDIVIGFSAVDLSVLTTGVPIVSGWFQIIDFSGKCNGQLKVCIIPLDSPTTLGKFISLPSQSKVLPVNHSNNSSPSYPGINAKQNNTNDNNSDVMTNNNEQINNKLMIDVGLNLGDASMSFLSLSLKQKLDELDEIKKRLQSRLEDVTNTAFDDDFENDCDSIEHDFECDNNDINNKQVINKSNDMQHLSNMCNDNKTVGVQTISADAGHSTNFDLQSERFIVNGVQHLNAPLSDNSQSISKSNKEIINSVNSDVKFNSNRDINSHVNSYDCHNSHTNMSDYRLDESKISHKQHSNVPITVSNSHYINKSTPIQGTKVHINHLLDKLSTQLTSAPPPITNVPMKRNIMDLLSNLRRNNNNFSSDIKCNREANVQTIPAKTHYNYVNDSSQNNSVEYTNSVALHSDEENKNEDEVPAKSQKTKKISTIIRNELIADDYNETIACDYLSSHLITSNIRHINFNSSLNPLLYSHLLPDSSALGNKNQQNSSSPSDSPEGEAIIQLDNRYIETFNATMNDGMSELRDIDNTELTSSRISHRIPSVLDDSKIFRENCSGISDNVDGNIDITVIHKPCNDDLMASNVIESTTTIPIGNNLQTTAEIDDNNLSSSSNVSVSTVSRQAPDGGNPTEDPSKLFITKDRTHSSFDN